LIVQLPLKPDLPTLCAKDVEKLEIIAKSVNGFVKCVFSHGLIG